jgi:hypothetical protein
MKGWIELSSDVDWEGYHGMWARKAPDGSWYVLKWTNMEDACGDDAPYKYDCQVKRLDLRELPDEEVLAALRCCGWKLCVQGPDQPTYAIVSEMGDVVAEGDLASLAPVLLECCVQYGLGAPLESFTGDKHAKRIRAEARRYAEQCMRDDAMLQERMERPVNAIGSTAAEYGRGDVQSALHRGPFDFRKNLMRKLHGLPAESEVQFGTLHPDGALTNRRSIKHSDLRKCKFAILVPEHYREDGSCRCDDPGHRAMMIAEWGYGAKDFADIPTREEG